MILKQRLKSLGEPPTLKTLLQLWSMEKPKGNSLVRVDDSTKKSLVTVDLIGAVFGCGGCPFQLGLGYFGRPIELGLNLGVHSTLDLDGLGLVNGL
jgi:hypothetical protein